MVTGLAIAVELSTYSLAFTALLGLVVTQRWWHGVVEKKGNGVAVGFEQGNRQSELQFESRKQRTLRDEGMRIEEFEEIPLQTRMGNENNKNCTKDT